MPKTPRRLPSASRHSQSLFCALPEMPERPLPPTTHPDRLELIRVSEKKWANGTVLHYYFFSSPARWSAPESKKKMVREAFAKWKSLGIGLEFKEVSSASEAEIRIGFERRSGHWSYVGRDVLGIGGGARTMNLDKGDHFDIDTPLHEIGHSLGFPHEHQNPIAGIVWNEEAVYRALAKPPNRWSREKTFHNIIRKIRPDEVQGSQWDPHSIMHYQFEAGLIEKPEEYAEGLFPDPGLSPRDVNWVKQFYPPIDERDYAKLKPFESVRLRLEPSEQANFLVQVEATRQYTFRTFGVSDTVLVLFEEIDGEPRFLTADDDSGEDYNANLQVKLFAGRRYILRLRLYFQDLSGDLSLMMW